MRPHGPRRPTSLLLAGTAPASAGSRTTAALVDLLCVAIAATPAVLGQLDVLSTGLGIALSAALTVILLISGAALWWTTGRTPGAVVARLRWVDAYAGTVPGVWRLPGRGITAVSLRARDPQQPIPAVGLDRLDFSPAAQRTPPPPSHALAPVAQPAPPVSAAPPAPPTPEHPAPAPPVPAAPPAPPPPPAAPAPRLPHVVLVAGGERVEITTTALLGRNPVAPAGTTVGEIVRVMDMSRSVSKTHAKLTWDGQALIIEDQGSTNGTSVRRADGTRLPCPPGIPVRATSGDTLHLGDKAYSVESAAAPVPTAALEITAEGVR